MAARRTRRTARRTRARRTKRKASARTKRTPRVAVKLKLHVWLDPRDMRIRMVVPGKFITTVADRPGLRRHRHLYGKLRSILKKRGKWFELA